MKTSALILIVAALVVPADASAKQPVKATVCGVSACHTETDESALIALSEGGPPTDPPRQAAAWYRSTITIGGPDGEHGSWAVVVLPAERLIGSRDINAGNRYTWMPMTAAGARGYRSITRGLAPRPAETLPGISDAPPAAQVTETVAPPADDGGGAAVWPWLLTIASVAAVLSGAWLLRRRPPRRGARGAAQPRPPRA